MKTLALIIGNNDYFEGAKLDNAVNDATSINKEFKRLGFETIFKCNCKAEDYSTLLAEFEEKISEFDASIFYYAGHGFELEGENYLSAVDSEIPPTSKYYAGRYSIRLNEILEIHKKYNDKINITIIDACRKSFDRSNSNSIAPMFAPKGSLIAFSTSTNEGASDIGFEGNSIYTGALLKYIGRERLSVEELFKKVRKTVYALSNGKQTTWEHTSLINDYYFNIGQRVVSTIIPYNENVVKDVNYDENVDDFSLLIKEVRILNWHRQNSAIDKLLDFQVDNLDKNQLFIFGRNLLQSSNFAYSSSDFFENLEENVLKYSVNGENHLLNGILYEIYFNSYGEFRMDNTKNHHLEEVLSLRKNDKLSNSFEFIKELLEEIDFNLIYIPEKEDNFIDIDILATEKNKTDSFNNIENIQVISSVKFNGIDITKKIMTYDVYGVNELGLKNAISSLLSAPNDLIQINSNIPLIKIGFFDYSPDEKW